MGFQTTSNPDIDLAQRVAVSRLDETYFNGRIDYNISPDPTPVCPLLKDIGELDAPDNTVTPRRILATNKPDNLVVVLNSTIGPVSERIKAGLNQGPDNAECGCQVWPAWKGRSLISAAVSFRPGVNGGAPSGVAAPGGTTRQSSAGNGRGSDYRGKTYTILDNFSYLAGTTRSRPASSFAPSAYR